MNQSWVDASRFNRKTGQDIWAVDYTAHPLLDPEFDQQGSRLLYLTRMTFRRILRSDGKDNGPGVICLINRMTQPHDQSS